MNECDKCSATLDPRWKFCLACGERVTGKQHDGPRRVRFDWQLTLGIILALAGIAMVIYLVIALIAPH